MTQDSEFTVTYKMTSWDYAAMNRALTRQSWKRRAFNLVILLAALWCFLVFMIGFYNPIIMFNSIWAVSLSNWPLLFLLIMAILFAFFAHWIGWAISFLYYRQMASADATITMKLLPTHIESHANIADSTLPWATVKRVILEKNYLFLPISKREAFILPKRSFTSVAEFDAAYRFACERMVPTKEQAPT